MRILPTLLLELSRGSSTCNTASLELPKNGKEWICDGGNNVQVPNKRKCVLECQDDYRVENSKFKIPYDMVHIIWTIYDGACGLWFY